MGRGSESFQKRQREKNKRERAAAKQAKRHGRIDTHLNDEETPMSSGRSEADLYEDFRLLSEKYQDGGIDEETFERGREEIFAQLGLEVQ